MQRRTAALVVTISALASLAVGAVALSIPAEKWSRWFYGDRFVFCEHEFDGTAIVFVVDRSGSNMAGFTVSKDHIVALIEQSPPHFEFGVVFSDNGTYRLPPTGSLLRATPANKRILKERITITPLGGGSCIKRNLLVGLDMARDSRGERRLLIYMGDGGGTCAGVSEIQYLRETLVEVAEENGGDVTIHCVNSDFDDPTPSDFLRELSAATGGDIIRLPLTP